MLDLAGTDTYDALSPYVRAAMNHRTRDMSLAPRIIFDYELLYLEKGELNIRIEQERHLVKAGSFILFKPGKEHEFLPSPGESWMPHIHFDVRFYADAEQVPVHFKSWRDCTEAERKWLRPDILGTELLYPDIIRIGNPAEAARTLMQLIYAYERRDPHFPLLQKALVLQILYQLKTGLDAEANRHLTQHNQALEDTVCYIMEHYREPIPVEQLAKIACLSVYHFSRLFREKYGLSPHQFQIRRRMEKAKEWMSYSRMSLTTVAEKTGYGSIYAFSKAFKQQEGVSPRHYLRGLYPTTNRGKEREEIDLRQP